MGDTSIRLSTEAKNRLDLFKKDNESYNDAIMRLTERDQWAGFGIAHGDPANARDGLDDIRQQMRSTIDDHGEDRAT